MSLSLWPGLRRGTWWMARSLGHVRGKPRTEHNRAFASLVKGNPATSAGLFLGRHRSSVSSSSASSPTLPCILDYDNCQAFVTDVLRPRPLRLPHAKWTEILSEITGTLPPYGPGVDPARKDDDPRAKKKRPRPATPLTAERVHHFMLNILLQERNLPLALDFLQFMTSSGVSLITSHKQLILQLFARCRPDTPEQDAQVLALLKQVRQELDQKQLSADEFESLLYAAEVNTSRWREALADVRLPAEGAAATLDEKSRALKYGTVVRALSVQAQRAVKERDLALARRIVLSDAFHCYASPIRQNMETSAGEDAPNREARDRAFAAWADACGPDAKGSAAMDDLLDCMAQNKAWLTDDVLAAVQRYAAKARKTVTLTTVDKKTSTCRHCKSVLPPPRIAPDDFERLKKAALKEILVKSDVYQTSSPKEVHRFGRLLEESDPYDVVIDGLNVAYWDANVHSRDGRTKSTNLFDIVQGLTDAGRKPLLVYRQGLRRMPHFLLMKRLGCQFITLDKVTEDDPFMILAALHSGPDTWLVTNDLLRQHVHALPELKLRQLFTEWQTNNQVTHYYNRTMDKVLMEFPLGFAIQPSSSKNHWHFPMIVTDADYAKRRRFFEYQKRSMNKPTRWLCWQRQ